MSSILFLIRLMLQGRLAALEWLGRTHPETARIRVGNRRAIFLNTPELVEEVLVRRTDEFRKGPALRIHARPLLGDGLLTSEGDDHRRARRLVAPAFAHQRVFRYAEVMSKLGRAACEAWPNGGEISMQREMTRLTLGIVGRTLFDVDLLEDADDLAKHITELIQFATDQARSLRPVPSDADTPRNRRANESVAALNRTMYGLIERRRQSGEDKGDLLSMLLMARDEDGNSLTDQEVRDQAMTLFLAGHETTANAMIWALYLLSRHMDIQRALQAQVRGAVGRRAVTFEDLAGLPLALEVFKETLRLFPPAFIVIREPFQDLMLDGRIPVRKRQIVAMSEWILHRDPRYFPEPQRFDPSRFTPENEAKIHRYAYFPFGAGRRICIGNQFALMEGQILLATVMQHATVLPCGKGKIGADPLMTLRPRAPANMRIERT